MLTVKGNKLLVLGDRHIDDVYQGSHINYQENCYWCMDKTLEIVKEEQPDLYLETGDLIGVRNNIARLEDRIMLRRTAEFFEDLKATCVVNTGNHDYFGNDHNNDYLLLSSLGYFYNPSMIADSNGKVVELVSDFEEDGKPVKVYVHFVPYGDEFIPLKPVKDCINIAITHNDFKVGATSYTRNPDAIDLETHEPFFGMDVIINGHIHDPAPRKTFKTVTGLDCTFLNLGSMARPKINENYDKVLYAVLEVRKGADGDVEIYFADKVIDLKPASKIFKAKNSNSSVKDSLDEELEDSGLESVFETLKDFNWQGVSMDKRIEIMNIEPEVKEIIYSYLNRV